MTTTTEDLWATAGDTAVGSADDPWSTNTEPPSDAYQNPYEMPATESDDSWLNGPDAVSAPATPSASFTDAPATGEAADAATHGFDLDRLFSGGHTSALTQPIAGLQDFELIAFIVVRDP